MVAYLQGWCYNSVTDQNGQSDTYQRSRSGLRVQSIKKKWSMLRRNQKQFILFCIVPLVSIIITAVVVTLVFGLQVATIVQFLLLSTWMFGVGSYIVFFDSKSRWPGVPAFQRFANLITFKR